MRWSLLLALLPIVSTASGQQHYDVIIRNGRIIDGTGSPWYSADVGIRDGRIAAIGRLGDAVGRRTIDAKEMIVAPGFIDMLGQSEVTILVNPHVPSKIFQGITTEITGEGESVAPLSDALIQADSMGFQHLHVTPDWRTFDQYFARLEKQGIGINFASYIGAAQTRRLILGDADVAPTPAQLTQMRALVREAMLQGAMGVSTALEYTPAPYASTEELIALATEAAKFGGIYASHMRDEGDNEPAALDEAIRIGREAHIPVEIFHLKVAGKSNFGKMPALVAKIEAARASGLDITADTYAYPAWFNGLSAFIPPWAHDGGDARLIERLRDPATRARIRKDMETPGGHWDNEWLEITGPKDILISAVQNPELLALRGKTLAGPWPSCGRRIPSMPCLTSSSRMRPLPMSRYSPCQNQISYWPCSSPGFRSAMILRVHRPMACIERNILIPAPTPLFPRIFAASTCEGRQSFPHCRMRFAKFLSALAAQRAC